MLQGRRRSREEMVGRMGLSSKTDREHEQNYEPVARTNGCRSQSLAVENILLIGMKV